MARKLSKREALAKTDSLFQMQHKKKTLEEEFN
jgi:hypothetical protein